jgi:glycosyltransferase involved in cell wall biosynthesis
VVIPVKDDAEALESCLRHLEAQTAMPLEVIVVDNGSSDESAEVGRRLGAIVVSESTPGIAAASRAGYDRATGELIARIDTDTQVDPSWIADISEYLAERPAADAVTGPARFVDGPRPLRWLAAVLYLGAYYVIAGATLTHVPLFGSNFAMRRSTWHDVRSSVHESERLHDDFDLSFHLGRRHVIRFSWRLTVGISMRPFWDGGGRQRVARGFRTIAAHWPEELPWLRLKRRLALRSRRRSRLPRRA